MKGMKRIKFKGKWITGCLLTSGRKHNHLYILPDGTSSMDEHEEVIAETVKVLTSDNKWKLLSEIEIK